MLSLTVTKEVHLQRMRTCEGCKFFKSITKSCGTLIVGRKLTQEELEELQKENLVKHYKKKIRLCGCWLPAKTYGLFESCPVGKWGMESLSKEQMQKLILFVEDLPQYGIYKSESVKELNRWFQFVTGSKKNISGCPTCVRDMVKTFRKEIKKYKLQFQKEEEHANTNTETN